MPINTPITIFKNDRDDNSNPKIFGESLFCFNKAILTTTNAIKTIKLIVVWAKYGIALCEGKNICPAIFNTDTIIAATINKIIELGLNTKPGCFDR